MFQSEGIDVVEKLIVFSDGLTAARKDQLEHYFGGRI
jgi:hypothetical protein